jgi:hypothetical protein
MTLRAVEHGTEPVTETRTVPEPDPNDPQSWLAVAGVLVLDVVVLGTGGSGLLEVGVVAAPPFSMSARMSVTKLTCPDEVTSNTSASSVAPSPECTMHVYR